jgi:hypothetical protein
MFLLTLECVSQSLPNCIWAALFAGDELMDMFAREALPALPFSLLRNPKPSGDKRAQDGAPGSFYGIEGKIYATRESLGGASASKRKLSIILKHAGYRWEPHDFYPLLLACLVVIS